MITSSGEVGVVCSGGVWDRAWEWAHIVLLARVAVAGQVRGGSCDWFHSGIVAGLGRVIIVPRDNPFQVAYGGCCLAVPGGGCSAAGVAGLASGDICTCPCRFSIEESSLTTQSIWWIPDLKYLWLLLYSKPFLSKKLIFHIFYARKSRHIFNNSSYFYFIVSYKIKKTNNK